MTKVITLAAMISAMATASFAGNLNAVETNEVENVFAAVPSSAGLSVPLAIGGAALLLAAVASGGDNVVATTTTERVAAGEED